MIWPEYIKAIPSRQIGAVVAVSVVGVKLDRYYPEIILSQNDLVRIRKIEIKRKDFSGDAKAVFLYMEGKRIRFAFQFDPLYAVNVSQIDPPTTSDRRSIPLHPEAAKD